MLRKTYRKREIEDSCPAHPKNAAIVHSTFHLDIKCDPYISSLEYPDQDTQEYHAVVAWKHKPLPDGQIAKQLRSPVTHRN